MNIAILGASRGIGRCLTHLALEQGHVVTALQRGPSDLEHARLTTVVGDIRDPATVAQAVANQDAVCLTIGITPTRKPVGVFSEGTARVLEVLDPTRQKLVAVTGIGAGDSRGQGGFGYDRIYFPLFLATIYRDKNRQESLIRNQAAPWLIVRPGFLTDGPRTRSYRTLDDLTGVRTGKISRLDVADYILKQLEAPSHFGSTPLLTY